MAIESPSSPALASLDLQTVSFAFPEDVEMRVLGEGFNSRVVQAGSHVLKVSKSFGDQLKMEQHAAVLKHEQELLAEYLGENLPTTSYVIAASESQPDMARVVAVQPYIGGLSLAEYTRHPEMRTDYLEKFLLGCLMMYKDTGQIADVANIETRFNVFRTRNLVIPVEGDDAHKPVLVDTNFGKVQRSKLLGGIWRKNINQGVVRAFTKLETFGH